MADLHGKIANDIAPLGGVPRCHKCEREQSLDKPQIARYLRSGWPRCCGETMLWVTARQLAEETAR